jgi:hypothetical protein
MYFGMSKKNNHFFHTLGKWMVKYTRFSATFFWFHHRHESWSGAPGAASMVIQWVASMWPPAETSLDARRLVYCAIFCGV